LKIRRGTDGSRARPAGDRRERSPYRLLKKSLSALMSSFLAEVGIQNRLKLLDSGSCFACPE
jgi:hypothetical protein